MIYLGFDSSTQSLTAVVIEIDDGERAVRLTRAFQFDDALTNYRHGVPP